MQCARYTEGSCRSCQWLEKPYTQPLSDKQHQLAALQDKQAVGAWLSVVFTPQQAFRNKAKMVVSGSVERPVFGILCQDGNSVDLCDCPLYPASFAPVFSVLKTSIACAGLTPYQVARRRGEFMLRFVLRSKTKLAQLQQELPWLQQQLPQLAVISANIQPVHQAILEGEEEIALTENQMLEEARCQ